MFFIPVFRGTKYKKVFSTFFTIIFCYLLNDKIGLVSRKKLVFAIYKTNSHCDLQIANNLSLLFINRKQLVFSLYKSQTTCIFDL